MKIKKVILIVIDTLRFKNLGVYGYHPSPTPNIDNFANESLVFTNAYATITKTDPSLTAIMSGKYPLSTGLVNQGKYITKEEEKNLENINFLAEHLKNHRWKTVAVDWLSRWHRRGYDYYSGKIIKPLDSIDPIANRSSIRSYFAFLDKYLVKLTKKDFFSGVYFSFFPTPQMPYYDRADVVVNKSIELIQQNQEKKLFLYIHLWDAHAPHTRPRSLKSMFFDTIDQAYNAEIKYLDLELGRLFNYLKKTRQLDDSLIILTGDHGENFERNEPLNHEGLYDDVVRIPLVFKHLLLPPQKIAALVQHIDILPTVLDLLNIPIPNNIDGKSLLPLVLSGKKKIRDHVYFEDIPYRFLRLVKKYRRRGIRQNDYKYIETYSGNYHALTSLTLRDELIPVKKELYNLKDDPLEKINLIHKKESKANNLAGLLSKEVISLNNKRLQNNSRLSKKVDKTKKIITHAINRYGFSNVAVAWKGGKDTTVMMHLIKTHYGKIPLKVFFNDTTLEFKETYQFIEKMKKLWNLDLVIVKHDKKELEEYHRSKDSGRKKELSRLMKITAIEKALKKYKFKGFMLGIRRDENPARANEKYISKRKNHIRIHPMLDWTEEDIWKYINIFGVPYNELYDRGYRSVGEKPFTQKSQGSERSGRDPEKEKAMDQLREMGYW